MSDLREGEPARVRGRVVRATELLTSALGQRPCVFWEVRSGLTEDRPGQRQGVDFWLEESTGRVLVRAERLEVDARAERRQRVLGQVDRDIHDVEKRQRLVKDALRRGEGNAKQWHAERRRLADLATLLCAVRAHARGRVHIGGSLAAQHAWITAHARPEAGAEVVATLELVVDEWEVALEEGHEIEVHGLCAREHSPRGAASGYREQATCLVLRGLADGGVKVSGLGAESASRSEKARVRPHATDQTESKEPKPKETEPAARQSLDRAVLGWVTGLCAGGALLAWWLLG